MTTTTLAFDIYGTLIDTNGIRAELQKLSVNQEVAFSNLWRDKQLEYSFRRGLMRQYKDFSVCIRQALDYACVYFNVVLTKNQKQHLLESYCYLPSFPDVKAGLISLRKSGFKIYAFSNGRSDMVAELLTNAKIENYFVDIISVDEIRSYKPNPDTYHHFIKRTNAITENSWLISSNSFDILGAISFGMQAAWVKRSTGAWLDPWEIQPTMVINNILQFSEQLKEKNNGRI